MRIQIFDVEHGQCALISTPNNKLIMIDTGVNTTRGWKPEDVLLGRMVDWLIITNLDSDHVADLDLGNNTSIRTIQINASVTADVLCSLKSDGFNSGVREIERWLRSKELGQIGANRSLYEQDWGGVSIETFENLYPMFKDTNNLSTAAFVQCYGFTILFPGDLEEEGWLALMQIPRFCAYLKQVNVLVASHHGRRNGFCEEIFGPYLCNPALIVISDKEIVHGTQDTTGNYYRKARGANVMGFSTQRSVLTTRKDGNIEINVLPNGDWTVETEKKNAGSGLASLSALF